MPKSLFYIILVWILSFESVYCQCIDRNFAFQTSEEIEYEIVYNWGFIWVPAGTVNFKVNSDNLNGKKVYHFDSYGTSYKSYDWFYKVRDRYQSLQDSATHRTIKAWRNTSEGGYEVFEDYQFDYSTNKIYSSTSTSKRPLKKDTINMAPCITDLLSAIYVARNIDFSKYKVNDKIPFWAIIVGKTQPLYIRYLGKDVLTTRDKHQYNCIKFSAKLVEGTVFKGGEDLTVWVTDDDNHLALFVDAKIIVGSVKAILVNSKNIRNPWVSKIN